MKFYLFINFNGTISLYIDMGNTFYHIVSGDMYLDVHAAKLNEAELNALYDEISADKALDTILYIRLTQACPTQFEEIVLNKVENICLQAC